MSQYLPPLDVKARRASVESNLRGALDTVSEIPLDLARAITTLEDTADAMFLRMDPARYGWAKQAGEVKTASELLNSAAAILTGVYTSHYDWWPKAAIDKTRDSIDPFMSEEAAIWWVGQKAWDSGDKDVRINHWGVVYRAPDRDELVKVLMWDDNRYCVRCGDHEFDTCDPRGKVIEPDIGSDWIGHYSCSHCHYIAALEPHRNNVR
jgi:hypothetical protein